MLSLAGSVGKRPIVAEIVFKQYRNMNLFPIRCRRVTEQLRTD